jgi:hypothetical protein
MLVNNDLSEVASVRDCAPNQDMLPISNASFNTEVSCITKEEVHIDAIIQDDLGKTAASQSQINRATVIATESGLYRKEEIHMNQGFPGLQGHIDCTHINRSASVPCYDPTEEEGNPQYRMPGMISV